MREIYTFLNYLNLILMVAGLFGTVSTDLLITLLRSTQNDNLDGRCFFPQTPQTKISPPHLSCSTFDSCQHISKKYADSGTAYKVICDVGYYLPNCKSLTIISCNNGKWVDFENREALSSLCEGIRHIKNKCGDLGDNESIDQNNNEAKANSSSSTDRRKPIHTAALGGQNNIIGSILSNNGNIEEVDNNGWTAVFYAVWKGQLETVKYLASKGANLNKEETYVYGKKPIHIAAHKGQNAIIEFLLSKDVNINEVDKDGWTPLFYAVSEGQFETTKYLVSKGANINIAETFVDGKKAIHIAAKEGHNTIIKFLVSKDVNINEVDKDGWTPLFYAVSKGRLETVKYFASKGENLNKEETLVDGKKVIHVAAREGYNTIIEFLLSNDVNVDEVDNNGWTAVSYAVWKGRLETVKYLASKGANLNITETSVDGKKLMHVAAKEGRNAIIEFLLSKEVSITEEDKNGLTPLFYAVLKGKFETIKYLVSKGANLNKALIDGRKVIHIAAQEGHNTIIEFFVSEHVGIDDADKYGWTPLFYAVRKGQLETVKYLVSKGANLNKETLTTGKKAIHIAAKEGQNTIIEFLLSKDVGIDEVDKDGWTPLFYAVSEGRLETVKYLASKGANLNKEALVDGRKTIHIAAREGHITIIKFLLSGPVGIDVVDKYGWTPLFYAVREGQLEAVKYLVSKGANLNKETLATGKKAIHIAAKEGHNTIIEFLLSNDVNVDEVDKDGWTPLFYAVSKGRLETVKYLASKGSIINKKDTTNKGRKPIHVAAEYGYESIMYFLLNNGANANETDNRGWTPLRYATEEKQMDIITFLKSKTAV